MAQHKYIQPQKFQTSSLKDTSIELVKSYINEHINEYKNGEIVSIEYLTEAGETAVTNAIVIINNGEANLIASVSDKDTLKIVETENEPEDKNALWLTDLTSGDTSGETSNLREEIRLLKSAVKMLQGLVNKHEYALNNTLAGGDIIANAEKFDLENKYPKEKPEDAEDPVSWAEEDFIITSFETYIADSPITEFIGSPGLYRHQKYPLNYKFYNIEGERVPDSYATVVAVADPVTIATITRNILYASTSGSCDIHISVNSESGETITEHYYGVQFDYNEGPDYPDYEEPNVHHQLVKSAESTEIMMQNSNYLLVGEFCWCIKENTLYLKEKASNGTVQLFKINGTGSIIPTGETITYYVDENGIFNAESSEGSIYVDDNGIVNFVGEVDENGIFWANSNSGYTPTPTPPTPTGETIDVTVTTDGTLDIESSDGSAGVSANGILSLPVTVDNNGILIL